MLSLRFVLPSLPGGTITKFMGLDGVELVMAFEEAFEIEFVDDSVAKMRMPRDVIEYVWRRVEHADSTVCLTQRAFNLLRTTLVQTTGRSRREIKPAVSLNELIPKAERKRLREQFSTIFQTQGFPEFVRPRALVRILKGVCFVVGLAAAVAILWLRPSWSVGDIAVALLLGGIAAGLAGLACATATRSRRTEFPSLIGTVGNLSRWIMIHRRDTRVARSQRRWTREQVAALVSEIVIEQLGCAEAYREDARFVEDLGMV